jgi:hypothetical protein
MNHPQISRDAASVAPPLQQQNPLSAINLPAAGGPRFHTTQTNAVEFPGAASLRFLKGAGLAAASREPLRRVLTSTPGLVRTPPPARKSLYQTCPSQRVQVCADFVQLVLVLHQICSIAQLFSSRLRAIFERKLNYETAHTLVYAKSPPAAGSKGLP